MHYYLLLRTPIFRVLLLDLFSDGVYIKCGETLGIYKSAEYLSRLGIVLADCVSGFHALSRLFRSLTRLHVISTMGAFTLRPGKPGISLLS